MVSPAEILLNIEIRKMGVADIPVVAALDRVGNLDPWSEAIFRREFELPISHTLLAVHKHRTEQEIAGFINYWVAADELQLHKIVVSRPLRRRGIAKCLLTEMTNRARAEHVKRAILEVQRDNMAAKTLYESFGYQAVAVREGYYEKSKGDALIMSVELGPGGGM